jgi:hypothetical protein
MAFSARRGFEVGWLWLSFSFAAAFPADKLASGRKQSDSQIRLRLPSDAAVSVRQQ